MNIEKGDAENMRPSLSAQIENPTDLPSALTEAVRVRLSREMETDLNKIEAYFRGRGFRHATRSHLIRIALDNFVENVQGSNPEIFE